MIVKENLWEVKHTSKHFAGTFRLLILHPFFIELIISRLYLVYSGLGATTCPRWTSMREPERFKGP